jgi:hypothetical protein
MGRVFADLVKRSEKQVPDAGRNHCAGAPASGHGQEKRASDAALGRSRGGLTTKIHLLADEHGHLDPSKRNGMLLAVPARNTDEARCRYRQRHNRHSALQGDVKHAFLQDPRRTFGTVIGHEAIHVDGHNLDETARIVTVLGMP